MGHFLCNYVNPYNTESTTEYSPRPNINTTSNTQKQLDSQLQVQAVVEACPTHLLMGRSSLSHTLWWNFLMQNTPGGLVGKESACKAGDANSIPGSGRSSGEGNGNPLQYSCLENSLNRGIWRATVCGIIVTYDCETHTSIVSGWKKWYILLKLHKNSLPGGEM